MVKKTKIYIRFICIMLISVFTMENVCCPADLLIVPFVNKGNLAVPSSFAPPIAYTRITHDLEVRVQALAGIKLFLQGKSIPAVNGMLIEGYSRSTSSEGSVEFVDVRYDNDGMVRALFRVGDGRDSVFEIKYRPSDMSCDRNIIDTGYLDEEDIIKSGQAGKVVSARSLLDSSSINKEYLVEDLLAFEEDLMGVDIRELDNSLDVKGEWEKDTGEYEIFLLIKEGEVIGYVEFEIKGDTSELIYIGIKRAQRYNHGGSLLLDSYFGYLGNNGIKHAIIKSKNGARNFYEEYLSSVGASYYADSATTEFHIDKIPQMRQHHKDGDAGSGAVVDTLTLSDVFTEKDKIVINEINVQLDNIKLDIDHIIPSSVSASYMEKANSLKDSWVREVLTAGGDEENFLVYNLAGLVTMMLSEDEEESAAAINAFRRAMAENPSDSKICRPAAEILCHASAEKPHFFRREYLASLERVINNGFYEKDPYVIFYASLAIANTVHFSDKNTAIVTSGLVMSLLEVLENSMMDPEVDSSTHGAVGLALIEIIKKYPALLPEDISKKLRIALERFSREYPEKNGKNPSNEFSRYVLSMAVSLADERSGIKEGAMVPDMNIPVDNFIFIDDFGDFGKPLKKFEEEMADNVRKFENVAGRAGANMIKNDMYITAEHGEWGDILSSESGVSHFALMGAFCNNCIARQTAEIIKKTLGERNDKEVYITLPLSAIQMSHSASVDTLKYYVPESFKYMENDSSLRSFTHPLNSEGDLMWNIPVYKDTRVLVLKDGEEVSEFINSDKDIGDPSIRTVVLNFLESEEAVENFLSEQNNLYFKKPEKYMYTMGDESTDEEYLLTRAMRVLGERPVSEIDVKVPRINMHIDLSVIPEEEGQLEENMRTIALMMARNNKYGMNISYMFNGDRKEQAMDLVRGNLRILADTFGIVTEDIIKSIGYIHEGEDAITVRLENLSRITEDRRVGEREYIIALKPGGDEKGFSIPNYAASSVMGLSLAALRKASDMVIHDRMDKRAYDQLKERILHRFRDIYHRLGVISDPSVFSPEELEMMVTGSSATKLYYTMYYALPPAIKVTGGLHEYHEIIRDTLIAA